MKKIILFLIIVAFPALCWSQRYSTVYRSKFSDRKLVPDQVYIDEDTLFTTIFSEVYELYDIPKNTIIRNPQLIKEVWEVHNLYYDLLFRAELYKACVKKGIKPFYIMRTGDSTIRP